MRFILCLGALFMLSTSVDAATVRRARHPERDFRVAPPPAAPPRGFAVPGWTDEETRQWINGASGPKG